MEPHRTQTRSLTVATFECDAYRRMTTAAMLRWQQEIGEHHAARFGLGWPQLAEKQRAFVLVQGGGRITRLPRCGETVTLETWSDRVHLARFYRGYRWKDERGQVLVDSAAVFVMVDLQTRRLHRPTAEESAALPSENRGTPAVDGARPKMAVDEVVLTRAVPYSATDFNRHMNNTVYADWMSDILPPAFREREPRQYRLHYASEAREGELLTLRRAVSENAVQTQMSRGDTLCFEGELIF